jgi:DNA repair protein RecN (Recombination protein N)
MLSRLSISNYALIQNLQVDFHPKLNTVTGETGAGKSIILGALALILGNRADLSVLKEKNKKCIVEGFFEVGNYQLEPLFEANDLDYEPVSILRREITPSGKSRAFVNDTPVNLKVIREIGLRLIDIHSQHQNLNLSNSKFQLNLIDSVAQSEKVLAQYKSIFKRYKQKQKSLEELHQKAEKEKADLDYFQFQFNQLEEAVLVETEQEELEQELEKLNHAEEIKSAFSELVHQLDDETFSVVQNVKNAHRVLAKIQEYISDAKELAERLQSSMLELKDIVDEAQNISETVEYNPVRIEQVNERLNLIYSLQQKHQVTTVKELIDLHQKLDAKINAIESYDNEVLALEKEVSESLSVLQDKATELTALRQKSFSKIEESVLTDLRQLGMPKARFKVMHQQPPNYLPDGNDIVSFVFSANPDSTPDDIAKIASGGEMSRLMLAIKNLLRTSKALPTVIFDEIDSGVSGEIALKMGTIIKSFASSTQIINITHLPQIAAKGDAHFVVFKGEDNGKTFTSIKELHKNERVEELAKMVGGETYTEATRKTAIELLNGN